MRLFAVSAAILVLVAFYSCLEYQRAGQGEEPNTLHMAGAVVFSGPAGECPAEPGSNLAAALAACEPSAPVCALQEEDSGYLYLCVLDRPRTVPLAGEYRTIRGLFESLFVQPDAGPAVYLLRESRVQHHRQR